MAPQNSLTSSTIWRFDPSTRALTTITDQQIKLAQRSMIQVGQSYFTLTVAGGIEWAHFTNLVSGQVRKVIKQQPKTPRENSQLLNY